MTAPTALRDAAPVEESESIDQCSKCASRVALMAPTSASPASAWLCRRCGSCYFARCAEGDAAGPASGVRSVSYYEVMKAIYVHMEGDSCPVLRDLRVSSASRPTPKFSGPESRKQKRFACPAQVTVVPLGHDFRIAAQPVRIVTTNLSGGGVALVHSRPVTQPYLAIDFAASGIDLLPAILEVTRVRQLSGGYEIAGKFVSRILH